MNGSTYLLLAIIALGFSLVGIVLESKLLCVIGQVLGLIVTYMILSEWLA